MFLITMIPFVGQQRKPKQKFMLGETRPVAMTLFGEFKFKDGFLTLNSFSLQLGLIQEIICVIRKLLGLEYCRCQILVNGEVVDGQKLFFPSTKRHTITMIKKNKNGETLQLWGKIRYSPVIG